jgi:TolB-like protein/Tfp pilus assembly protein PilF
MSRYAAFFRELKRRRVYHVGVLYAATAFVAAQAAEIFLPRLGLPDWTITAVVVLAVAGFPVALILGWVFDITPAGVRRTETATADAAARPGTWRVAGGVAFAALVLVAGGWWLSSIALRSSPALLSLAVLPFENHTGDPEQEYFVDGMHEALTAELYRISALSVISRTSTMQYKGVRKPAPQIARELGVEGLVEGSVARDGDQVRITVQLIHGATDRHLWAASYQRELRSILALQAEVARAISRQIRITLAPEEELRLASARPVNPEAYEAYLRGKFYASQLSPEGYERGFSYLHEAIEKDPTHPVPYIQLAIGLTLFGKGPAPPPGVFLQARAAAQKALELDETLAEAHAALAHIYLAYYWDWPAAAQAYRRAEELNPNIAAADVWNGTAWYFVMIGDEEKARAAIRRNKELDPLTPLWAAWRAWLYWALGDAEAAMTEARTALEINPDLPVGLYVLGGLYSDKGMHDEAIAVHTRAATVSPFWGWALGTSYARAGRKAEARAIAAAFEEGMLSPRYLYEGERIRNPWGLAEIHTALGETDKAFEWLEAGYAQRQSWMPWMGRNPNFEPLRDDPRFRGLLRRMNLPD